MVTRYWFARHGESIANAEGWLSGWIDVELTARGEAEARAAMSTLVDLPARRCLVSDLRRARRTASEMLTLRADIPVHIDAGLRERRMGIFQGRATADVVGDPALRRLIRTWDDAPEGGETHRTLVRRALATLRHWDDGTPTLIVAHGALIRDVLGVIDGKAPAAIMEERPAGHCVVVGREVDLRSATLPSC